MSMTREPPIDEREWQAQERAMRAAQGDDAGNEDLMTAHYRVVAHAVRCTPASHPPFDFASGVARLAATRGDTGFERMLSRILLAVFAISSIVVVALYGGQWWQSIHQAFGGDTLAWLIAGTGCLGVSWMFDQLRTIRGGSELMPAR